MGTMEENEFRRIMEKVTKIDKHKGKEFGGKKSKSRIAMGVRAEGQGLMHTDFSPTKGGQLSDLIQEANDYLHSNTTVVPFSCEWVTTSDTSSSSGIHVQLQGKVCPDTKSSYYDKPTGKQTKYCRFLRLWTLPVRDKSNSQPTGKTIKCETILPKKKHADDSNNDYETFPETMERLQNHRFQGEILNIQTDVIGLQKGVTRSGLHADAQQLYWSENNREMKHLSLLRVFTVDNPNTHQERIDYRDFVPKRSPDGGWQRLPELKPALQEWMDEQEVNGWKTLNIQTLDVALGSHLGTLPENRKVLGDTTLHLHDGNTAPSYVKIMRVYMKKTEVQFETILAIEDFHPGMTVKSACPEFVDQAYNYSRLASFLDYSRPSLVAVETVTYDVPAYSSADLYTTHTLPSDKTDRVVFVFRLYLEQNYSLPPSRVLPPRIPGELQEKSSTCAIM